MARPKVILFDVNETLLDLQPVKEGIGRLLGAGRKPPGCGSRRCSSIRW